MTGEGALAFFDAIAPIVHRHSIDMDVAWMQSRYDKDGPGGGRRAYVNCPMSRDQYEAFIDALLAAEKTEFREFEGTPYFDGCLPIEVMAERGRETLRHGPMKPVGLTNAHDPTVKPYAVVQLRQDNALGTLFNMVGFQTKLKYGEQGRIFRMIPGLEGRGIRPARRHAPQHLSQFAAAARRPSAPEGRAAPALRRPDHRLRGLCRKRRGRPDRRPPRRRRAAGHRALEPPPPTTAIGALLNHITGGHIESIDAGPRSFQPMNVNFGLFPPIAEPRFDEAGKRLSGPERGLARKRALSARAERDLARWAEGGARAGAIRGGLGTPAELCTSSLWRTAMFSLVAQFGFSWLVAVLLRKPSILAVGKAWISLDSLVRNQTYQWVTRIFAKNFSPPFVLAEASCQKGQPTIVACGSAGLFMGQA